MESARKSSRNINTPRQTPYQRTRSSESRPLPSKHQQQSMQHKLLEFFKPRIQGISLTHLQSPGVKEFMEMLTVLMQTVDPNFCLTGKIEDEVPFLFKQLGYPNTISKNSLLAIGAPNSWPALLSALSWLLDHVAYIELDFDEQESQAHYSDDKLMMEAYSLFLNGEDYNSELLELRTRLAERAQKQIAYHEKLLEIVAMMKQEKKELSRFSNPESIDKDIEMIRAEIDTLRNIEDLLFRVAEWEENVKFIYTEHEACLQVKDAKERELDEISEVLRNQVYSKEDIEQIQRNIQMTEQSLNSIVNRRQEILRKNLEIRQNIDELVSEATSRVQHYMNNLVALEMLPPGAKNSYSQDLRLGFYPENLEKESLLEDDLLGPSGILGTLEKVKGKFLSEIEKEFKMYNDELARVEALRDEKRVLLEQQQDQIYRIRQRIDATIEDNASKTGIAKEVYNLKNQTVLSLESEISKERARNSELVLLSKGLSEEIEQHLQERQKLDKDFQRFIGEFEFMISDSLKEFRDYQSKVIEVMQEMQDWSRTQSL